MANSYTCCYTHFVFSTKNREPAIAPDFRADLWAYMGGIARDKKMKVLEIGGTEDHTHLLISMPATLSTAQAMNQIKGASAAWINEHRRARAHFHWQDGYGAFSVSASQTPMVMRYIQRQPEHHRKITYQDELRALLRKHGVQYDERYLWG